MGYSLALHLLQVGVLLLGRCGCLAGTGGDDPVGALLGDAFLLLNRCGCGLEAHPLFRLGHYFPLPSSGLSLWAGADSPLKTARSGIFRKSLAAMSLLTDTE